MNDDAPPISSGEQSTVGQGTEQPRSLWMRVRGIPPAMGLFFKDRFGRIHAWRVALVEDWKEFLTKAWSVRFIVIGFIIEMGYDLTPALQDAIPLQYYMPLRGLFVAATLITQIWKQKGLRDGDDA